MTRLVMVAFLIMLSTSKSMAADVDIDPESRACPGLPVNHFESKFPATIKRLTFNDAMLDTFVELWKAGSRPDFPTQPERVVVYAVPGLPLIIGYQERHCIIAYLAIESTVLWRWLHQHIGWNA